MCGYAAGQAKAAGAALDVVEADMRDFRVTGPDGAQVLFDAAVTMLNSACHLFTLDDLVRHLTAVRAHLVPGGLYIVELAHPADFFAPEPRTSSDWTVDADGVHAEVRWGGRGDRIDPLTQVTRRAHDDHGHVQGRHDPHGQRRGPEPVLDPDGVHRRHRAGQRGRGLRPSAR